MLQPPPIRHKYKWPVSGGSIDRGRGLHRKIPRRTISRPRRGGKKRRKGKNKIGNRTVNRAGKLARFGGKRTTKRNRRWIFDSRGEEERKNSRGYMQIFVSTRYASSSWIPLTRFSVSLFLVGDKNRCRVLKKMGFRFESRARTNLLSIRNYLFFQGEGGRKGIKKREGKCVKKERGEKGKERVTAFELLCEIDNGGHVKLYCSPGKGF